MLVLGEWRVVGDGEHLRLLHRDKELVRVGGASERVRVFRHGNGKAPYWFYDNEGKFGESACERYELPPYGTSLTSSHRR